ncbi:hypothetical protein [Arabiibacter massiliensis]|uniref:hypothetical protein n=1 Tax=Arabiibacter massiliensis TaxID=1870985 RepID=UPI0009BB56B0|nr:hypothetical protein [Arabiibacter massiliensis]
MEEKLYMVMDDTNNIYDFDEIPDVPPELEARAYRNAEKAYQEAKRKRLAEEAAEARKVALG